MKFSNGFILQDNRQVVHAFNTSILAFDILDMTCVNRNVIFLNMNGNLLDEEFNMIKTDNKIVRILHNPHNFVFIDSCGYMLTIANPRDPETFTYRMFENVKCHNIKQFDRYNGVIGYQGTLKSFEIVYILEYDGTLHCFRYDGKNESKHITKHNVYQNVSKFIMRYKTDLGELLYMMIVTIENQNTSRVIVHSYNKGTYRMNTRHHINHMETQHRYKFKMELRDVMFDNAIDDDNIVYYKINDWYKTSFNRYAGCNLDIRKMNDVIDILTNDDHTMLICNSELYVYCGISKMWIKIKSPHGRYFIDEKYIYHLQCSIDGDDINENIYHVNIVEDDIHQALSGGVHINELSEFLMNIPSMNMFNQVKYNEAMNDAYLDIVFDWCV